MQKVLGIVGPTAVGKTALAVKLAHQLDGEVISGDSMQVYRHLDIGTAKVTKSEMAGIPHYLIDVRDVHDQYSVADFVSEATTLISAIIKRGHLPIIAGGTGFYLQALLNNLALGGADSTQSQVRSRLQDQAQSMGPLKLWQQLARIDPQAAAEIPVNNVRRVIRALEVYQLTGRRFSEQAVGQLPHYNALLVGLNAARPLVYDRINQRVDRMVANGLLAEAQWLFERGGAMLPAGKGIGYRELYPYFTGTVSLPEAVAQIKQDSRHYAKRQLTWFRNKMDVRWFNILQHPDQQITIEKLVGDWWQT